MSAAGEPIGVGVIGVGFMGRTHIAAYNAAAAAGHPCRLVAVCDRSGRCLADPAPRRGNLSTGSGEALFDPARVAVYGRPEDLLADPGVRLVSVCTYTDTHAALTREALRAGKHVLTEKPIALRSCEVAALAAEVDAAARGGLVGMPAMCMRFWPAWRWLRERVRDGSFGRVRSATFQRLATPPAWSAEFYADPARSGGALVDLHIHDADFIHWCFGKPTSVVSGGTIDHLTTIYRFDDGPEHVVAQGAWHHTPGFGFRMRYVVVFEQATADFDIGRTPQLLLSRGGNAEAIELEPITGYDGEIRHLLGVLREGRTQTDATMAEAAQVARLLEAERESLERRLPVAVP